MPAALGFYVLLGVVLKVTHGHFHAIGLGLIVIGFIAYSVAGFRAADNLDPRRSRRSITQRIALACVLFAMLLWHSAELIYAQDNAARQWLAQAATVALVATLIAWVGSFKSVRFGGAIDMSVLAVAMLAALVMRVLTLFASPEPGIDVWVIGNLGSDFLLQGQNPYSASYPDIYQGQFDHSPHFFYWPGYLLTVAPFRGLLGDVRAATVAADMLIVAVLWRVGRRFGLPRKTRGLVCLLWLLNPVSLFVLEQAWIDPLLMVGLAVLLLCLVEGWWVATGMALAYLVGVKQYGVLIGMLTLASLWSLRHSMTHRPNFRSILLAGGVTTVLLFGPFLVLDPRAFFENTLQPYLDVGLRSDALSIPAFIYNAWDIRIPDWLLGSVVLSCTVAMCAWLAIGRPRLDQPRFDRLMFAIAFVLATFFLLGKLAFCNYYYLVSFVVLLHLLTLNNRAMNKPALRKPTRSSVGHGVLP